MAINNVDKFNLNNELIYFKDSAARSDISDIKAELINKQDKLFKPLTAADVVDNLFTQDKERPLSANQGVVLDKKIKDLDSELDSKYSELKQADSSLGDRITQNYNYFNGKVTQLETSVSDLDSELDSKYSELKQADSSLGDRITSVNNRISNYNRYDEPSKTLFFIK